MFDLVRKALGDPAPAVVDAALQLLRKTSFVGAAPLTRIFRESSDERVRLAVLDGIGINRDPLGAARVLLEVARQETGAVRQAAEEKLARLAKRGAKRSSRCSVRRATRRRASRARRWSACSCPRPAPERERREQANHHQAQGHEAAPVEHAAAARPQHQHQEAAPVTIQRRLRCEVWMRAICSRRIRCSSSVTHSTSIGSPRFWRWICSSR